MDFYSDILSPRQKEVLELYYYEDFSLAEISENLGITRQGVRDAIKHGEKALKRFENILGLMEKSKKINQVAKRIVETTNDKSIKLLAEEIIAQQINNYSE